MFYAFNFSDLSASFSKRNQLYVYLCPVENVLPVGLPKYPYIMELFTNEEQNYM